MPKPFFGMQRLIFWLAYPLLWIISILPFPIFYLVSDGIYLLVYYIVRYRRDTVTENLKLVFPEKSSSEINKIRKKFYHHMVDMFLEMIKSISISEAELKKRFTFESIGEFQNFRRENRSVLLACGHYASYEWMNALQLYDLDYVGFGIYKKVKNRYFDQLAKDIRGRYEGILIPTRAATKTIAENEKKEIRGVYAMVADQSPRLNRSRAWTDFMGIKVPVFTGIENLSRAHHMPVVYLHVEKVKRGYYHATFKTLTSNPSAEPPFEVVRKYFDELEQQIKAAPEFYLWTHKRWKHRNAPIPEDSVIITRDQQFL